MGVRDARMHRDVVPVIRKKLKAWHRRHARALPWRETSDPYRIWISEIMLQQTRVEAVIPYYNRFLAAFPDIPALASASEDAVLRLWEGLGYYSRARNLHAAAKEVVTNHGGVMPDTVEGLRSLPGIGAYTAGAVASIAFGRCAALVDGNVSRVLARIFLVEDSIDATAGRRRIWELAETLVPAREPGLFNQALMELGACVCLPKTPRCGACPVHGVCGAYRGDCAGAYPVRGAKKAVPHKEVVCGVLVRGGRVLLGKRAAGMLRGLWEFPGGAIQPGETHAEALTRIVGGETGLHVKVGAPLCAVDHAYSHFTLTMHAYVCDVRGRTHCRHHAALAWVTEAELASYPMPRTDRIVADHWRNR